MKVFTQDVEFVVTTVDCTAIAAIYGFDVCLARHYSFSSETQRLFLRGMLFMRTAKCVIATSLDLKCKGQLRGILRLMKCLTVLANRRGHKNCVPSTFPGTLKAKFSLSLTLNRSLSVLGLHVLRLLLLCDLVQGSNCHCFLVFYKWPKQHSE